ncbi:hypothetical protein MAE_35010 [Microcystis aeruginosa NIES-843]|uniref:Uncharacterized protein n=2 Tax=Microcystis TaxID=1125 RepID=B0JMN8_MICAN|nr:hypothetical protein MAE_35010 [Microcystis aeruginosa NIES-843]
MRRPPIKEIDLKMENTIINGLLAQLDNEQNSDRRAEIIRKLGEYPEPQVIKKLWDLRNNLESESDDFVQYEIKLSLRKVTNHPSININFFLDNLGVFQSKDNNSQAPKVLIDADLIEEFLLRNQTTLNREAARVMGLVLEGKINPYIGEMGLIQIWHSMKNLRLFGNCYAMDGGYKGWNPYIERHLAIFVNCFLSRAN